MVRGLKITCMHAWQASQNVGKKVSIMIMSRDLVVERLGQKSELSITINEKD